MKHNRFRVLLVILISVFGVFFTFSGCATGYKGPKAAMTVIEAKESTDNTAVILRGKIERKLDNDRYMFSDDTGKIIIDINFWVWGSISIDQNDMVEITGVVAKHFSEIYVDIQKIKRL